jgi:phage I-like protein
MPNRIRRFFSIRSRRNAKHLSHEVICNNVQLDKDSDDKFSVYLAFSSKLPEDGSVPDWIEILPIGEFDTNADDQRGPFRADGPAVIAATLKRGIDRVSIDYDHRTFTASDSRAAGWIRELKIEGEALMARVEWTPDAAAAIKKKEYRFVSPVFKCQPDDPDAKEDDISGDVLFIRGAALTNDPALTMTAILSTARTVTMKGKAMKMSEICATLEKAFPKHSPEQIQELATHAASMQAHDDDGGTDVPNDAEDGDGDGDGGSMSATNPYAGETEAQARTRHAAMATERTTTKVVETAEQKTAREAREASEISTAHARDVELAARGGERRVTSTATRLNVANDPMVVKMAKRLGDLEQERAKEIAERTVTEALRARKILPTQKEWALAYCSADPAGFAAFIGKQPTFIANQDGSTFVGAPPAPNGGVVLSATDEKMCAMFGYDREKFAKNKAAFKAGTFIPKAVTIINDEAAA